MEGNPETSTEQSRYLADRSLADIIAGVKKTETLDPGPAGGRPSKRSPQRVADILLALRGGATRKDACDLNGIVYETFRAWMKTGEAEVYKAMEEDREPEGDFSGFYVSVRQAEAYCAVRMTQTVTKAGKTDWRAALEWLKRRRRTDFGDSLDVTKLTTEQLLQLYAETESEG